MIRRRKLDMQNLCNIGISKPREFGKWQEKFFISQQQPETVFRDIGYFNRGSAYAKRCGFHIHAPVQGEVLRGFHVEKNRQIEQVQFLDQANIWLRRFGLAHEHAFSVLPAKKRKIGNRLRGKLLDS